MHSNDVQICKCADMQIQEKDNLILKLTFHFSLDIIEFTEKLQQDRKFNLANQLFRSGTSIGANVREAQGCESKSDFTHKMKVAYKEVGETRYWLELCKQAESYPEPGKLLDDITFKSARQNN